jgi:hypothetical protein
LILFQVLKMLQIRVAKVVVQVVRLREVANQMLVALVAIATIITVTKDKRYLS